MKVKNGVGSGRPPRHGAAHFVNHMATGAPQWVGWGGGRAQRITYRLARCSTRAPLRDPRSSQDQTPSIVVVLKRAKTAQEFAVSAVPPPLFLLLPPAHAQAVVVHCVHQHHRRRRLLYHCRRRCHQGLGRRRGGGGCGCGGC